MFASIGLLYVGIVLALISVTLGAFIFFIGVPVSYWLRKIPRQNQRVKWRHRLLGVGVSFFVLPALACGWLLYVGDNYWLYRGWDEHWRAPLVYPYEIRNYGIVANAECVGETPGCQRLAQEVYCIGTWKNDTCLINNVSGYAVAGQFIFGVIHGNAAWFVLDGKTGEREYFSSLTEMAAAAKQRGINTLPAIKLSHEQIQAYWNR